MIWWSSTEQNGGPKMNCPLLSARNGITALVPVPSNSKVFADRNGERAHLIIIKDCAECCNQTTATTA